MSKPITLFKRVLEELALLKIMSKNIGPKSVGSKKIKWGPKKFWSKKDIVQKIKVQKYVGSKTILGPKSFKYKTLWTQKF